MTDGRNFSDYIVFVDESGSASLSGVDPDFPLFVLAFIIVRKEVYSREIVPAIQEFKLRHFGHDQIVLHEREIRRDSGAFGFLKDKGKKDAFLGELTSLIEASSFDLVSVVIHKENLKRKYSTPENPYNLAMQFGLERISGLLFDRGAWEEKNINNPVVHMVVERRGKVEDDELELVFRRICSGWNYDGRVVPFDIVFADKKSNSSGLQFADLIARPIGLRTIRPEQPNRTYEILEKKLVFVGGYKSGWGLKIFP